MRLSELVIFWNLPDSTSPALGSHTLSLSVTQTWILGIKLEHLCSKGKHCTELSLQPTANRQVSGIVPYRSSLPLERHSLSFPNLSFSASRSFRKGPFISHSGLLALLVQMLTEACWVGPSFSYTEVERLRLSVWSVLIPAARDGREREEDKGLVVITMPTIFFQVPV